MMTRGVATAIGAAVLFGAAAPLAKLLLGSAPPLLVAGLLYLGSGLGLSLVLMLKRARGVAIAPVPRAGRARFAAAVALGGIVGPALLMQGLATSAASTSSLLLNLEGVLTALVAWIVVREHTHVRMVLGFVAIALGGIVLTIDPHAAVPVSAGALFVVGACACWAIDNNLTQGVSSSDAVLLAAIKGIVAGVTNTSLAFVVLHAPLPDPGLVVAALAVGLFGYGVSLVLFVTALRELGTARTGAYFSTAPFVGALLALPLLHEAMSPALAVAGALMGLGLALHLTEQHAHPHAHEPLAHTHAHFHDEHHQHAHAPGDDVAPGAEHTHAHVHAPLTHTHPHTPDLHHRHDHGA